MDTFVKTLLVGSGGFIGVNMRYWLGIWLQPRFDTSFPWSTFLINISGAFLIGLLFGLIDHQNGHPNWKLFAGIGILGGYTTYSTFAYEALSLLNKKAYWSGLLYIEGSAILTVFAAWLGLVLAGFLSGKV